MGLVMIFIVIEPVVGLLRARPQDVNFDFPLGVAAETSAQVHGYAQDALIDRAYHARLSAQLELMLERDGRFTLESLSVKTSEDYSRLESLTLVVKARQKRPDAVPFIRVEPVEISTARTQGTEAVETDGLKKEIADFYNLSADNIMIKE
jgi:hypothetical protein